MGCNSVRGGSTVIMEGGVAMDRDDQLSPGGFNSYTLCDFASNDRAQCIPILYYHEVIGHTHSKPFTMCCPSCGLVHPL